MKFSIVEHYIQSHCVILNQLIELGNVPIKIIVLVWKLLSVKTMLWMTKDVPTYQRLLFLNMTNVSNQCITTKKADIDYILNILFACIFSFVGVLHSFCYIQLPYSEHTRQRSNEDGNSN